MSVYCISTTFRHLFIIQVYYLQYILSYSNKVIINKPLSFALSIHTYFHILVYGISKTQEQYTLENMHESLNPLTRIPTVIEDIP